MNPMQELSIKLTELMIKQDIVTSVAMKQDPFFDDAVKALHKKKKEILVYVAHMLEEEGQKGYEKGYREGENEYTVDTGF